MRALSADEAAFLRAIGATPHDDTPRLAYADWLDERGGEANTARAEFIRLQIAEEAKGVPSIQPCGERPDLTPREDELIARYSRWDDPDGWAADVPTFPDVSVETDYAPYSRGFLWRVSAKSVGAFLRAAPKLYARVPATLLTHFSGLTIKDAKELAASKYLARIRGWQDCFCPRTDKMLAAVAQSPYLANFRILRWSGTQVTAAGIRTFLAAPSLVRLTRLRLDSCRGLGDDGVEAIAAARTTEGLEHLGLTHCGLGAAAVRAVAAAPGLLRSLRELSLRKNRLDDDAAAALAAVPWPSLDDLILSDNRITDRGAEAILNSPTLRGGPGRVWLHRNPISAPVRAELTRVFGDRVWF
jgi:uncharacterized protein (TIGR02996 family)